MSLERRVHGRVKIVIPKTRRVDRWLLERYPALYERVRVLRWRLKDHLFWLTGRGVFQRLLAVADKPSHIEIETLSQCNSTCTFCPVNRISDPRAPTRMDEDLFRRIIDELSEWDYRGTLNLFSNNEPFLDNRIFDFAAYARAKLPHAYLQLFTNGSALDLPRAERILSHLSHLLINDYATSHRLHENVAAIVRGLEATRPELAEKLTVVYRLLDEFKGNRAGNAPNRRIRPTRFKSRCAYPFFQMVIRPDGKLSMCGTDALGEETLGDVVSEGVRGAWTNARRRSACESMLNGRRANSLCAKCDCLNWSRPSRIARALVTGNYRRITT